jgi:hypothetical protein
VAEDVRDGIVSIKEALATYCVVLTEDKTVDVSATQWLRQSKHK